MRSELGGGGPDGSAFSQALATLKENGSNILVVGSVDAAGHEAVCRRLLGAGAPRSRIVVRSDDGTCGWLPDAEEPGSTRVIGYEEPPGGHSATVVESDLVGPLGQAIARRIDDLAGQPEGVEPAELRLCFDALGPVFSEHDPETVFRLVHVVTARIRDVNGMGHFHIRVPRDDDHVKLLEPMFDAIVEVRDDGDGEWEHRWRLLDQDVDSQWIGL